MGLPPATKFGPYEILAPIGAGGMGEVYRARDTRLGRIVALKILPTNVSASPEARKRFDREAHAISSVNHPNICQLYDVGEQGGTNYLVMEYLEGETLAQRLQKGMVPVCDTLKIAIAIAIADALEVAHSKGVIHRDFKPGNLFITHRGEAKVLDFGLAKSTPRTDWSNSELADEITLSYEEQLTGPGEPLGTIAYMSPEQARGENVDVRTDLFSFGVVLYEMTTGHRPFTGPTAAVVFDAILNRQPLPPTVLNASVPLSLEKSVMRLLSKNRTARHHDARELLDELKGIQFELETGGQPCAPAHPDSSIVVLPFEDLSPDHSQQPFCEGMAAEIINSLGTVEGLRVISRTSSVRCREKGLDIGEIGQHLNVRTVLEGTVRKSGARLRVTAQLISTSDGAQMWSERYDRAEGDVFDIQEEIAAAIVKNLKGRLLGTGVPAVRRVTDNVEAYKLYLKGRYFWERRNRGALQNAMTYFEQAISADPEYALAHAELADCHTVMGIYSMRPTRDLRPRALELAMRALELDSALPEAHSALGAVRYFLERNWVAATSSFTRALELDSRLAVALGYRATMLAATKTRPQDAISDCIAAMRLEPDSGLIAYIAAITHYWTRDVDGAAVLIDRALELEPKAAFAHWLRALIFSVKGLHEEAISTTTRAVVVADHHPLLVSALGTACARAGRTAEAEDLIEELRSRARREYIGPYYIGEIYLALDRTDQACKWFEQAAEEVNPLFMGAAVAPHYDSLRNEPRFRATLQRMNLPKE